MAKKTTLTWYSKGKRWFKSFNYKQHAVSCRQLRKLYPHLMVADTKEGSQRAAEVWWSDKLAALAAHPQADDYKLAINTRQLMSEWCKREGQTETRTEIIKEIDIFRTAQKKGITMEAKAGYIPASWNQGQELPEGLWLGDLAADPTYKPVNGETWGARIKEVQKVIDWEATESETSLRGLIKKYASHKIPDVTPFRVDTIKRHLTAFADWLGSDNIGAIDFEMSLADYRVYLINESEYNSTHTQSSRMKTIKSFATWLWDTAKVLDECPRNLKKLGIKLEHKPVVIWTDDQVEEILKTTKGQHRLYILLMLNCGMYQGDIGQLKKSQVDLDTGTITRARSKTQGGKVVAYPLWFETLELLKAHWSKDKELVLTTRTGAPIYLQVVDETTGKVKRKDMINTTHWQWQKKNEVRYPALKSLRKTGRSKLDDHDAFARFAPYYLAHSTSSAEQSTDETYYRTPSQERFRAAIKWLGEQWGIA